MSDEEADEPDWDDVMAPHLEYFSDRANLIFSYHFFVFEFEGDADLVLEASESHRAWSLKTIQSACLHATLIALRDLDDFFKPRDKDTRKDDLRASDFGDTRSRQFLAGERKWIDKLIAHTTQLGPSKLGYRWEVLELISKAVAQCDSFLEFIRAEYGLSHFNTCIAAVSLQARSKAILKWIKEEAEKRKTEDGV